MVLFLISLMGISMHSYQIYCLFFIFPLQRLRWGQFKMYAYKDVCLSHDIQAIQTTQTHRIKYLALSKQESPLPLSVSSQAQGGSAFIIPKFQSIYTMTKDFLIMTFLETKLVCNYIVSLKPYRFYICTIFFCTGLQMI